MPKVLSMAKAISRKSRLSISRSLIAWLSGLIFSRGMSQVSAMISATLSKVDEIRLFQADRCGAVLGCCPYSEGYRQVQRLVAPGIFAVLPTFRPVAIQPRISK